jgi:hypothetical protein
MEKRNEASPLLGSYDDDAPVWSDAPEWSEPDDAAPTAAVGIVDHQRSSVQSRGVCVCVCVCVFAHARACAPMLSCVIIPQPAALTPLARCDAMVMLGRTDTCPLCLFSRLRCGVQQTRSHGRGHSTQPRTTRAGGAALARPFWWAASPRRKAWRGSRHKWIVLRRCHAALLSTG